VGEENEPEEMNRDCSKIITFSALKIPFLPMGNRDFEEMSLSCFFSALRTTMSENCGDEEMHSKMDRVETKVEGEEVVWSLSKSLLSFS